MGSLPDAEYEQFTRNKRGDPRCAGWSHKNRKDDTLRPQRNPEGAGWSQRAHGDALRPGAGVREHQRAGVAPLPGSAWGQGGWSLRAVAAEVSRVQPIIAAQRFVNIRLSFKQVFRLLKEGFGQYRKKLRWLGGAIRVQPGLVVVCQAVLQVIPGFGHGFLPVPGLFAVKRGCAIGGAVQVIQLVGEFVKDHIMGTVRLGNGAFALTPGQYHLTTGRRLTRTDLVAVADHQAVTFRAPGPVHVRIHENTLHFIVV